jgi:ABC-type lipoprotein release transport system permease subunit
MEPKTIARIAVLPFGLMLGAISAVIGVIVGVIFAVVFTPLYFYTPTIPGYTGPTLPTLPIFGFLFGIGAVVIFPIAMFVTGLVQGLIFAAVYNFLVPRIGGIILYFR